MSDASEEEITKADTNLYYFLLGAIRVHDRFEREGKLPLRPLEDGGRKEDQKPPLGQ